MIILDFLFTICHTPFQNAKNGRLAALIWLSPPLAFVSMGLLNILAFYTLNSGIPTKIATILIFILFGGLFYLLYSIYIKGNREVGKGRFPILSGILIFVMIVGSIIFVAVSLAKFR